LYGRKGGLSATMRIRMHLPGDIVRLLSLSSSRPYFRALDVRCNQCSEPPTNSDIDEAGPATAPLHHRIVAQSYDWTSGTHTFSYLHPMTSKPVLCRYVHGIACRRDGS
jgi:hypothetical protein